MPDFAYFCGTEQFQPEALLEHAVQYAWARTAEELVEMYRPLVEVGADIVTIQVTSVDQDATIKLLGNDVLPALRRLAPPA